MQLSDRYIHERLPTHQQDTFRGPNIGSKRKYHAPGDLGIPLGRAENSAEPKRKELTKPQMDSFSIIQDEAKLSLLDDEEDYEYCDGNYKSSFASLTYNATKPMFEKEIKQNTVTRKADKKIASNYQSHLLKMIQAQGLIDHSD